MNNNEAKTDLDWDGIEENKIDEPSVLPQKNVESHEELSIGYEKKAQSSKGKMNLSSVLSLMLNYLKRNWIFLTIVFVIWMFIGTNNYGYGIYRIPIIGQLYRLVNSKGLSGILMYLTATWNGPVGMPPYGGITLYTFIVAATAKPAYLLAMTGVILPSIKSFFRGSNPLQPYKIAYSKVGVVIKSLKGNLMLIGLVIACSGVAMAVSNLLSRNGKIDKSFVIILLAFTLFKSLSGRLPSVLYIIFRKIIGVFIAMLPGGISNTNYLDVAFSGMMAGFLIAIIIGNFGENAGYLLGFISLACGIVLMLANKRKA